MATRIGVDVGGTFTDVALLDDRTGAVAVHKLPSSPEDPSIAITEGVAGLLATEGIDAAEVASLSHGTTVATNALLEHRGARVAVVTTRGFRDVLEIGRQRREHLYDLFAQKPPALVPRSLCFELTERIRADGSIDRPLAEDELPALLRALAAEDVEAIAVCFVNSYVNPVHEAAVEAAVRSELPDAYVSASHHVAPEFREYERFLTTVVNAYVGPGMKRYFGRLAGRVEAAGIPRAPTVMQSNGGIISLSTAGEAPVRTILSGPSAGVVGATTIGSWAELPDLITLDMGGTSTDICLIKGGRPVVARDRQVGGYTVRVPSVDVHTVGAGGGSIASVDRAGALSVGPNSAGAVPGPAAYGRGGARATVTDANVLLGRLNPDFLLGGALEVDEPAVEAALAELAAELGGESTEAALGVVRIVTSHMARAIRKVSVDRGEDPRDFVLVAFGGAGPVHAAEVAAEIGMREVLVPPSPGILCALGLLATDVQMDFGRTRLLSADGGSLDRVNEIFSELTEEAERWLERERTPAASRRVAWVADMRYRRQNYELALPLAAERLDAARLAEVVESFGRHHERAYGFRDDGSACDFVAFRVVATGERPKLPRISLERGSGSPGPGAITGRRRAHFWDGGFDVVEVYERGALRAGDELPGPAVVEQLDSTTLVPPGWTLRVDERGNLLLSLEGPR